eukprot:06534_6
MRMHESRKNYRRRKTDRHFCSAATAICNTWSNPYWKQARNQNAKSLRPWPAVGVTFEHLSQRSINQTKKRLMLSRHIDPLFKFHVLVKVHGALNTRKQKRKGSFPRALFLPKTRLKQMNQTWT